MSELKPPKTGSKLAKLSLFLRGEGRTLKALSKSLGWQPHTVRAAMTRLRQRGYEIERVPDEGAKSTVFRLADIS
ncbi:MAG: DUF3489 domain-containing protein [Pseudomonadota bacterium]